jgi:hypothetical protein
MIVSAVHILVLKPPLRHPLERRLPFQIVFGQVDVALHGAAVDAAALARETNVVHLYS